MTWVKICGVTRLADALAAVDAGADAIGFNFWPRSKRYRPPSEFAVIADAVRGRIERIGVFVDASPEEIEAAFAAGLIDVAQLHGDEDPGLCARFAGRAIKALRLAGTFSLDQIDRYPGERLLVDAPFAGFGGSGLLVDETLARAARERADAAGRRLILAGGLSPENVAGVVARVRPFGVDVASGVESAPGIKDAERVRAFVAAARAAATDSRASDERTP